MVQAVEAALSFRIGRIIRELLARIDTGPVAPLTQGVFAGHGQEAVLAETEASPAADICRLPIDFAAVQALGIGDMCAVTDVHAAAMIGFAQDDVDHARDRIGAILGRRAIPQDLNITDGTRGDRVEVDGGRATADRAIDVHQRRDMAALAVDENQRLVWRQAAKRGRTDNVRPVIDCGLVEVEAWNGRAENLVQLDPAGFGQFLDRENVYRNSRFKRCAVGGAGPGDNDFALSKLAAGGIRRFLREC